MSKRKVTCGVHSALANFNTPVAIFRCNSLLHPLYLQHLCRNGHIRMKSIPQGTGKRDTKSMPHDYDAIIVGAGPSGATCAMYAARHGLRVLLVDKAKFPRDKICGDAISGKSVTLLRELGLLDEIEKQPRVRATGVTFSAPNGTIATVPFTPPRAERESYGYVCRRKVFDNVLFQAAKQEVDTIEGFTVTDVLRDGSRICGVVGRNGRANEREITARVVVGADGYKSVVARKTGVYEHDPRHWVVATRAYYRGVTEVSDAIEIHFVKDILPGYFWIFPLDNGLVNVGIGMLHCELKKRGISLKQAHLDATRSGFFRRRFARAEMLTEIAGWNLPVGSKRRRVHGEGFLLLGDAAGLIDPFSGEGIGNGMCSGKIAAEVIAGAARAGRFDAGFLQQYASRLWATLGDELQTSYTLQKIGRVRPLLNLVVSRAAKSRKVREWISEMMAGAASKESLKSPFTYLRLFFM